MEKSYARFWAIVNRMPKCGESAEEIKMRLVRTFSIGNETGSLRAMTDKEYDQMCRSLEAQWPTEGDAARQASLRYRRSQCLHLMQKLGVDTSDWARVNAFCEDRRIAGVRLYELDTDGLKELTRKLRSIMRKRDEARPMAPVVPMNNAKQ